MRNRRRRQSGFTIVEIIVVVCILAVLASVAIRELRDYTRRARVSEVILAATDCKTMISESYMTRDQPPAAGAWGCERTGGTGYVGAVQTSPNGIIRVVIANLDPVLNGHHVYLVPARLGGTPMSTPADLGSGVRMWVCGSDSGLLRNSLPASCRANAAVASTEDYE